MNRTPVPFPRKCREAGDQTKRSRNRLKAAGLCLALVGAVVLRTVVNRGAPVRPRFLAESVSLSEPPALPTQDPFAASTQLASLTPLRAAAESTGRDAAAAARFARAALDAQDLLEARGAFAAAMAGDGVKDPGILAGLAETDARLGRCAEALDEYTRVQASFPDDVRGYVGASQTLDLLGRRRDAVAMLDTALAKLSANDIAARMRVAAQYEAFGDVARALAQVTELLRIAPADDDLALLSAHLLIKSGRPDAAIPVLRQVLARQPANTRARYQLGVALLSPSSAHPEPQLAEDALLTAVESNSSETPAYRRLTEMYQEQGRFRACAYMSLQLLSAIPDSAEARLSLAYAYGRLGDSAAATEQRRIAAALVDRDREIAQLETEIRQRPTDGALRRALGRLHARFGRPLQALAALQAAYICSRGNIGVARELGALHRTLGLPAPERIVAQW